MNRSETILIYLIGFVVTNLFNFEMYQYNQIHSLKYLKEEDLPKKKKKKNFNQYGNM